MDKVQNWVVVVGPCAPDEADKLMKDWIAMREKAGEHIKDEEIQRDLVYSRDKRDLVRYRVLSGAAE